MKLGWGHGVGEVWAELQEWATNIQTNYIAQMKFSMNKIHF